MTVLLVLGTFLVFIVLDYALNRRKVMATVPRYRSPQSRCAYGAGSDYVNGFHVPENLSYHPGHSWLVRERKNVVRVGADEFAAALAGKLEKIELPKPGQWIRQGQKVLSFYRDGEKTEMVSPTEGEVMEVNAEVLRQSGPAAPGPLRQRLAGGGPCPGRGKHRPQPGPQRPGARVDAGSRGAPLCPPAARWPGPWRPMAAAPPTTCWPSLPGCQLEAGHRRVLPHA